MWRCTVIALLVLICIPPTVLAADQPNIVLILADDLGYSDLGCFGGEIETPSLDRLAAEGIRFRHFYNAGKCEPTRASLLSGRYWQQCGLGIQSGPTMGHVMQQAGYATFAVGKWHLRGNPVDRGFDRYFGHLSGATHYFQGDETYRLDKSPFQPKIGEFYSTDANADYAIDFIKNGHEKRPDQPFFLYMAFNAPHSPLHALPADIEKYQGKFDSGWDALSTRRYQRMLRLGIVDQNWPRPQRPETIPAWDSLTEEEQEFETTRMEVYAAMVDRMDQAIGRLLDELEEMGERDNTIVFFLSDNGASPYDRLPRDKPSPSNTTHNVGLGWAYLSGTPFRHYKRNMYHGGNCTPLIVSWPKTIEHRGEVTDHTGHLLDLMATVVEVGGATWPERFAGEELGPLYGASLLPVFQGKEFKRAGTLFFQLFDHRAIVDAKWKLVSDWGRPWQLYNLESDRAEQNDLSSEYPERAVRLAKQWELLASEMNVRLKNAGGEPVYRRKNDVKQVSQSRQDAREQDAEAVERWRKKDWPRIRKKPVGMAPALY